MAKKSYKQKYSSEDGVWRTIGGRRVFIRNGQKLSDAMVESGKFKKGNREEVQRNLADKRIKKLGDENADIWKKTNKFDNNWYDESGALTKEGRKFYNKREGNAQEIKDLTKIYHWGEYENPVKAESTHDLVGQHISGRQQLGDIGRKSLNKKLDDDYISYIASTTNSTNDSYGYAFNEMLNEADRKGLKVKGIDIGNNGKNRASIEFENGGKIDFYDLKEGKGTISNVSTDDFERIQGVMNTYRTHSKEDMSYDFNNGKWINNNENVRINNRPDIDNSKYDVKYSSVMDRYEKDADFRKMLEGEHQKTLDTARKEINSYFDMTLEDRKRLVGNEDDLYKALNQDYGNIDREDFDKIYNEEMQRRVAVNTAKKFGAKDVTVNGKKIDLSDGRKSWRDYDKEDGGLLRDTAIQAFKDGDISKEDLMKDYFNEKLEDGGVLRGTALDAYKNGDISLEELNRVYLGRGKKYTPDERDILDRFGEDYGYDKGSNLDNLVGQIDYMKNPGESIHRTAERLVEGGDFLIYNGDVMKYLDDRKIPYTEDNFFDKYKRDMADKIEKLYNQGVEGNLKKRFKGTYEDLKKNTKMSESEIMDYLRKLKDR